MSGSWQKVRVSKYTRNLHPDDAQPGLPNPGLIESSDRYEEFHVKKNNSDEWVGRTAIVNNWLVSNQTKVGYTITAALDPKEAGLPTASDFLDSILQAEDLTNAVQPKDPPTSVQRKKRTRKSTKRKS